MEIGAGSGQEACGRATQNASKIEKVEEKIDGCSAQEAEIEPPLKRLGRPGGSLEGGLRLRYWEAAPLRRPQRPRPWQVWQRPCKPGRLWQGRLWQAGSGRVWQALSKSGRL